MLGERGGRGEGEREGGDYLRRFEFACIIQLAEGGACLVCSSFRLSSSQKPGVTVVCNSLIIAHIN